MEEKERVEVDELQGRLEVLLMGRQVVYSFIRRDNFAAMARYTILLPALGTPALQSYQVRV